LCVLKLFIDKNLWFLIRLWFSFKIKPVFDPVKADLRVSLPRSGARKMPSRGRVCSPCTSLGYGWRDDQLKGPPVCRYALDRSHHRPLNTCASIPSADKQGRRLEQLALSTTLGILLKLSKYPISRNILSYLLPLTQSRLMILDTRYIPYWTAGRGDL
jgi:hypothetical protein